MPTFIFFENGAPKGVTVEGLQGRQSCGFTDDGRVSQVRGADRQALEAVVRALGAKDKDMSGRETDHKED
ncbi:hypothetical protein E4U23_003429 [Claviceps purpurea]|nr:hypothetical protein E4U11_005938 [Claviceps purpurea]KAG6192782.1 hypothetical protein E4U27_001945 [Claviceps purpurea]KAG6247933.1 hypothetical protein E4U23_003429 [Claviceps purpurea]